MKNITPEIEELQNRYQELQGENTALMHEKSALEDKVAELQVLVKHYEERYRLSREKKFGASSEKTSPEQGTLGLLDEAENEANARVAEPPLEIITYERRKKSEGKREEDLSDLPVERVEHTLPENERVCPACGGPMHVMGHDVRRELKIVPATVSVVEHVREVYSCRACEKNEISVPVTKAPMPEPAIKGSVASPSSVAHIMVQKYVNAVPLYRQEMGFLAEGLLLSRQTMANWMIHCSAHWLEPLYGLMKSRLLAAEVLHADETVLQVLKEPGRKSRSESYMWLYRTSGDAAFPIVLYEYQETRSSSHPRRFLAGFSGYLHADGYAGYHNLPVNIRIVGCWAHARRKFDEAVKSAPPDEQKNSVAHIGLDFCNRLFGLEKEYENLSAEERYKERLERSRPVFEEFYAWARSANALPKSALGRALRYALEQRPYLENVFLDGRLELSNNRAERSIKPFVIGRKNWLFSATPKGARASSVIYSVVETAKENRLNPFAYLKHIFETMPNIASEAYDTLLPWSGSLPEGCKIPPK